MSLRSMNNLRVLITGSHGFIGKNLAARLSEMSVREVLTYNRGDNPDQLPSLIERSDAIVHLAGEMRPIDESYLFTSNVGLTENICAIVKSCNQRKILLLASSIQAVQDSPYGLSKLQAEKIAIRLADETDCAVVIYRLPHVFGKWCRPNYNSVIATFCHNIARGLPIKINDPDSIIRPVYIDDVVYEFMRAISGQISSFSMGKVSPEYEITIGELARQIVGFKNSRDVLISDRTGNGLTRALYSTYMSYLAPDDFSYGIPVHRDERGLFAEVLKTPDTGQFSYFTARVGVTRGGHYHHTKTEKFLVVSGKAHFCFRSIIDNECVEIFTSGEIPRVVETIPGWVHDITNIGENDLVVVLWASEIYDPIHPDTVISNGSIVGVI
jgi:UDP-2-acetamido-2,6-beta-L-arabino-hexul-4-ose reductase